MKFRATAALAVTAVLAGGFYFLYLLPESREAAVQKELQGRIFRVAGERVDLIRIKNQHGAFELVRDGSAWLLTMPRRARTDGETVRRILDVVLQARMVKVVSSGSGRLAEFGLDSPKVKLLVGYGGTIDELLLADPNPANTHLYAYGRGRNAVFLVERRIGAVLNAGLYDFRRKEAFEFDPAAVERMRITRKSGVLEFQRTAEGEWVIQEPVQARGSARRIEEFITAVAQQRAEEFFDDAVPDRRRYSDSVRIDLSGQAGSARVSLSVYYWGTGAREGAVVYQHGAGYYARTQREFWNFLQKEYFFFTSRNLFFFSEDDIVSIAVTAENSSFVLSRSGSRWQIDGKPADPLAVRSLLQHLQAWEAVGLERWRRLDVEKAGPVITIELTARNGEKAGRLKIFGRQESAGYSAEGLKETVTFYALSDALAVPCSVNSLDVAKVTDRGAFEARETL